MIIDDIDADAVATAIVSCFDDWKDARRDKEQIWQECLTNYLVYLDEAKFQNWPWRSRVADTFSQEQGDTIASSLRSALFPVNEEYFDVVGDDELGRTHKDDMQAYMNMLLHKMKFVERLNPWCKQLAVLGNAPLLLTWETLELSRRKRQLTVNLQTGERTYPVIDERRKRYEGPGIEVLDAFDVVFDPGAKHPRHTPFIRRVAVPKDKIHALYPTLTADELALVQGESSPMPVDATQSLKIQRARIFGITSPDALPHVSSEDADADTVDVLELYGDLVVDGQRHLEMMGAVLNRAVLAKFEPNTFWGGRNLLWGTYDELWFTAFAKGPLEPVRGTQELIDTFSNQKVDILNVITNGCFAYVDDGVIDPATLMIQPRAGVEVGNIANIKELHPNTNISLTYQEIETLRARGERSTGKSRFDMGQAPGGRRTAFEASMIGQGGGARAQDITKHIANDALEYVLEWMLVTVQQMKWDSGEISNDVLLGEYHINYLGADLTAMRQFEIQQAQLFMDMIGRYPALGEATNIPVLVGEIARLFHFRNQNIAKPIAQYQQEQLLKQAQAEAEAQPGGMGGSQGIPDPEAMMATEEMGG